MREFVNYCVSCEKEIYCDGGFLKGIILEDGKTICFECHENTKENE